MLLTTNWSTLNNKDVNIAFNELQERIDFSMNTKAPLKIVEIPSHRIWCEPWITKGISKSMERCIQLNKNVM